MEFLMAGKQKLLSGIGIGIAVLCLAFAAVKLLNKGSVPSPLAPVILTGAVLRQDDDPRNQTPLANVEVTGEDGPVTAYGKSDSSGLFTLTIHQRLGTRRRISLKFDCPNYRPVEMTVPRSPDRLWIVRMPALSQKSVKKANSETTFAKIVRIKDVRIRYLSKDQTVVSVGALAKQFEVPNIGNVPCDKREPCSPDGKWKAAMNLMPLDAQAGNEFQNVRVSCIAGPCPFTKVESDDLSRPVRKLGIKILNWSDTTDFLVEADISRTELTNKIHHSYPFIVRQTMNFALPGGSEGLSIEANVDGQEIVFPVGPESILTWATCGVQAPPDGNRLYRCQLKPGYSFEQ
jgi:hypothetical protein